MDLSGAFPPGLEAFGRSLRPAAAGAVPLPREIVALHGSGRAAVSLWSQHYLLALVPPLLAAALCTARAPRLALEGTAVLPGPDGMPCAVCLPGLDCLGRADLPGSLLHDHLCPLAAHLATLGLPAPVLWSNAGYVISWTLRTLGERECCPGAAALLTLLQSPFWAGGTNPLPPKVRAVMGEGGRSACCLRFQVPGVPRCPQCPRACPKEPAVG